MQDTIQNYAMTYCADPATKELAAETTSTMQKIYRNILEELDYQMMEACEDLDGYWVGYDDVMADNLSGTLLAAFYKEAFGGNQGASETALGRCVQNDTMIQCMSYNSDNGTNVATYDSNKDECIFSDEWYLSHCKLMGGYYENSICYVAK